MPKIDLRSIDELALLAHLPLTAKQKAQFAKELSTILDFVAQINKLKGGRVEVATTITGLANVFREDYPDKSQCLPVTQALKNAPTTKDGYFKVKAIFTDETP